MQHRQSRKDAGETLVEVLVALSILGLAGVAIMAGLGLAVKSSDIHRKDTTSGAAAKAYAEAIEDFVQGHQSAFTCSPDYSAATVGFIVPTGYTPSYTWNALGPTGAAAACTINSVQLVKVTVASSDGRGGEHLTFVLRRPCNGDQTVAATTCT
ncbi:MAG: PulJ/GspJ family protein [Marmoricola sp.]